MIKNFNTILIVVCGIVFLYLNISCAINSELQSFYKIQRLNNSGEVVQTYYSRSFPWGSGNGVSFREYYSDKIIRLSCPYTAEDIGTK